MNDFQRNESETNLMFMISRRSHQTWKLYFVSLIIILWINLITFPAEDTKCQLQD